MFLPQVVENDLFAKNGKRIDDINSLLEYLQVYLGNDKTADDEDNDESRSFHIAANIEYCYEPQYISIEQHKTSRRSANEYCVDHTSKKPFSIALDIQVPPPKA